VKEVDIHTPRTRTRIHTRILAHACAALKGGGVGALHMHPFVKFTNSASLKHRCGQRSVALKQLPPREKRMVEKIIETSPPIHKSSLKVLQRVFQHPISHDLQWNDLKKLFVNFGAEILQGGGKVDDEEAQLHKTPKNTCVLLRGHKQVFHHRSVPTELAMGHSLSEHEVLEARRFLRRAFEYEAEPDSIKRLVIVVDNTHARLFTLCEEHRNGPICLCSRLLQKQASKSKQAKAKASKQKQASKSKQAKVSASKCKRKRKSRQN